MLPKHSLDRATSVSLIILAGVVALFALVAAQPVTSVGVLTRDAAATLDGAWYVGAVSNMGLVGWSAAMTLFTVAAVVAVTAASQGPRVHPYWYGAGLSAMFLVDDMLQVHEELAPRLIGSELPVYGAYAALTLLWLSNVTLRRATSQTMVLAGALLFASIAVDVVWTSDSAARLLVEDGAKFAGIWLWAWVGAQCIAAELERLRRAATHLGVTVDG